MEKKMTGCAAVNLKKGKGKVGRQSYFVEIKT